VAETRYEDLPKDAVHETKRVLLDSVGVALGSLSTERGRIALAYARHIGGPPEATILGAWDKVARALPVPSVEQRAHAASSDMIVTKWPTPSE
jgi:2-methylcitrate dehydratase PrpD